MRHALIAAFIGLALHEVACAASIKMLCLRPDEKEKAPCYRVVHVLTEEAAKAKEAQGCIRDTGRKAASQVATPQTKSEVNGAR